MNQTVRKFINILRGYAFKVSRTDRLIEDVDIRDRFLKVLLKGVDGEL